MPSADDQKAAQAWLADFARRVRASSAGCTCNDEWEAMTHICAPPLSSRIDFYWWTVAAHDWINRRLGRPLAAPEWSLAHTLFTAR